MSSKKLRSSEIISKVILERFKYLQKVKGWNDTALAEKLGLSRGYVGDISRGLVRFKSDRIWSAVRAKIPEWEDYLRCRSDEPPEKRGREDWELESTLKVTHGNAIQLVSPGEGHKQRLHAKLEEILDSGNIGLITAITCNLEEFARSAQKDRILETIGRKPGVSLAVEGDGLPEQPSPSSKEK